MAGKRRVRWADYRAPEYAKAGPQTVAVLPVAAVEQHGPHLPVGTDAIIAEGMLETLVARLPDDLDLRILPLQAVGKSNEHLYAAGTLTLPYSVLVEAWTELGLSVARAGIGKLVFVNSHGGNEEIMGIVARELRVRAGMLAVKTGWHRFPPPDGLFSEAERRYGIHGGDAETSLVLHFRPDLVDMEAARDFRSCVEGWETRFAHLKATGAHAYAWIASDLNPAGVVGEAHLASAEKGRVYAEKMAAGMIELLREVAGAPLPE